MISLSEHPLLALKQVGLSTLATFAFGGALAAQESKQQAVAVFAETPPTIDGELDSMWSQVDWNMIEIPASMIDPRWVTPTADFAGQFKVLFDADSVYVAIEVVDDIVAVYSTGASAWSDDSIELFFDLANDGGPYDGLTLQTMFRAVDDGEFYYKQQGAMPFTTTQVDREMVLTEKGYRVEVRLDWSVWGVDILDLLNQQIGFDIHINDKDVINPEATWATARLIWNNQQLNNHEFADEFGELTLLESPPTREYGPYILQDIAGEAWVLSDEFEWLKADAAPFLYSTSFQRWLFLPEESFSVAGAWAYAFAGSDSGGIAAEGEPAYGPYRLTTIENQEWIETAEFGWLVADQRPWFYSFANQGWLYLEESAFTGTGAWVFGSK